MHYFPELWPYWRTVYLHFGQPFVCIGLPIFWWNINYSFFYRQTMHFHYRQESCNRGWQKSWVVWWINQNIFAREKRSSFFWRNTTYKHASHNQIKKKRFWRKFFPKKKRSGSGCILNIVAAAAAVCSDWNCCCIAAVVVFKAPNNLNVRIGVTP